MQLYVDRLSVPIACKSGPVDQVKLQQLLFYGSSSDESLYSTPRRLEGSTSGQRTAEEMVRNYGNVRTPES